MAEDFVSADGSPLAMYLALPADDGPSVVHGAIPARSSILELGSGPGRETRVLVALGHHVVAVDDSEEMLAHVTGAETVCADVFDLDLDRRFDVVVAGSTLIKPSSGERRRLLGVCARHVDPGGTVLLERFRPGWLPTAVETTGVSGPVEMTFTPLSRSGDIVEATMTYRLAGSTWEQRFEAADVGDDVLADEAAAEGLAFDGSITDDGTWVRLRPTV